MSYFTTQRYWLEAYEPELASEKILVVEDNLIIQKVHQLYLEKLGYGVEITDTGHSALNLHKMKHYTAILLDLRLPDISGERVLNTIRSREEGTEVHTPVILVTAHGFSQDQMLYLNKGADAYLQKPISKDMLRHVLEALMRSE